MNGIRVLDGKIGYKDIPKTACTAIKEELYRAQFGKQFDGEGYLDDPDEFAVHKYLRNEVKLEGYINDCEFKFIVVRDPVKRFLSAYSSRVLDHRELSREFLKKNLKNEHLIRYLPELNPSLDEFISNLLIYTKVTIVDHHLSPLHIKLSGAKLSFFDKVYKFEELGQLEKDLSKRLKTEFKLKFTHKSSKKVGLGELKYSHVKFLLNYYREDYKLLKDYYSQDDVWAEWLTQASTGARLEFKTRRVYYKLRSLIR